MKTSLTRRSFLQRSGLAAAGIAAGPLILRGAEVPSAKLRVAVMGTNGRGMAHISSFLTDPNAEIAYVCDVDSRAAGKALAAVEKRQEAKARGITDFRDALDDPSVDIVSIATPNHWHAPATIMACAAGKHVYVEKPGSHNAREGEWMTEAARKHKRQVQMGNQRRSWPWVVEAMQRLHAGEIGRVLFARSWYNNQRGSIGRGQQVSAPDWLNYDLWQGPAPARPYKDNVVHYNWHWHWHWGGGELANNGIHALDLVRWGLQVDYPHRVTCSGSRYHFDDDQETPDICVATYEFEGKGATWEGHSCDPRGFEGQGFGVTFYGDKGSLVIAGNDCRVYDLSNKVVAEIKGQWDDADHFKNLLEAIRTGQPLKSQIAEGQKSTLLCHLGNIAYRTGRALSVDSSNGRIKNDRDAMRFWQRDYRKGWEPKV